MRAILNNISPRSRSGATGSLFLIIRLLWFNLTPPPQAGENIYGSRDNSFARIKHKSTKDRHPRQHPGNARPIQNLKSGSTRDIIALSSILSSPIEASLLLSNVYYAYMRAHEPRKPFCVPRSFFFRVRSGYSTPQCPLTSEFPQNCGFRGCGSDDFPFWHSVRPKTALNLILLIIILMDMSF